MVVRYIYPYVHTYMHTNGSFQQKASTNGVSLLEGYFHMSTVDSMLQTGINVITQGKLCDTYERVGERSRGQLGELRTWCCLLKVHNPY